MYSSRKDLVFRKGSFVAFVKAHIELPRRFVGTELAGTAIARRVDVLHRCAVARIGRRFLRARLHGAPILQFGLLPRTHRGSANLVRGFSQLFEFGFLGGEVFGDFLDAAFGGLQFGGKGFDLGF